MVEGRVFGVVCGGLLFAFAVHAGDAGTAARPCVRAGCSRELCTDKPDTVTTCAWRDRYRCFEDAECKRQPNGQCGYTPTKKLKACLAQADKDKAGSEDVQ